MTGALTCAKKLKVKVLKINKDIVRMWNSTNYYEKKLVTLWVLVEKKRIEAD
jgi:hypothetical protein